MCHPFISHLALRQHAALKPHAARIAHHILHSEADNMSSISRVIRIRANNVVAALGRDPADASLLAALVCDFI